MGSFTQYQDGTGTTFFDTTIIEYGYDWQSYTIPNTGAAYIRGTYVTTLTYPWALCDTVEGVLDSNESNTATFPLTYVWVDVDYTNTADITTYPYTTGSLAASVSGTSAAPYSQPTQTPSAYGSFTIVPAGHTGKVQGLSSATSATLEISKSSTSRSESATYDGGSYVTYATFRIDFTPAGYQLAPLSQRVDYTDRSYQSERKTTTVSESGWLIPTFANVYQGGGQSFLYSTYAPMFALRNSSGGYDFFNGFTFSNMEASTSSTDRIVTTESTTRSYQVFTTIGNGGIISPYTTGSTTTGVSTSYVVPSFVAAGIQAYQQNLYPHPLSDQRSGELDTRMLLWGSPRENALNTTFFDAPLLSAGISLLYPQATPTSFGTEAFYFSQEYGYYALSSNSVTMYGQTTTQGTGTATQTYLTQTSVSEEIAINSCSFSSLGAFSSGVSGVSRGTWEMTYSGLLGVTSYTTGSASASSSSSYFAGISSTAIPATREFYPLIPGGQANPVPTTFTNFTFKTTTMTVGDSNPNAYIVWGTQGLVAELNGLQGAF
jgi:hypothetical protein